MSVHKEMREFSGTFELPLRGLVVSRCCVDKALSLELFSESIEVLIRFEGILRLCRGEEVLSLNVEEPGSLAPALTLLGEKVDTASTTRRGTLILRFEGGTQLEADPDPDYESWELTSTEGMRLVSIPGGGLAIWPPDAE